MALAISDMGKQNVQLVGQRVEKLVAVTTDTDYLAGGYEILAADVGLTSIDIVDLGVAAGFIPEWDAANDKLKILYGNTDAADGPMIEVANGLNGIDGIVFRGVIQGVV